MDEITPTQAGWTQKVQNNFLPFLTAQKLIA